MRFSNIDWSALNLKPLVKATRVTEPEIFGAFDSEAGMHIKNGVSAKPKKVVSEAVSRIIFRAMEGVAAMAFDVDDDEDDEENNDLPLPCTYPEIEAGVMDVLNKLAVEWPGAAKAN